MKFPFKLFAKREKREKKPDRVITFAEIGTQLRQSVVFLTIASLLIVLLLELPMKAQAFFDDSPILFWLGSFVAGSLFILLTRWADRDREVRLLPREQVGTNVIAGIGAGVALLVWALIANRVFASLFPVLYPDMRGSPDLYQPQFLLIAVLSTIIIIPLGEELLFRGYLLKLESARRPPLLALILVAALYGLRSLDPFSFFTNFVSGLLLGGLTRRFHLSSAIIAHAVGNLMVLLYLLLF